MESTLPVQLNIPTDLVCDLLVRPEMTRITNPRPVFGWVVHSRFQSAYRILVGSSEEDLDRDVGAMWDSEKQTSSRSQNIRYEGKPLQSSSTYFWKVCTWDENGECDGFSSTQTFHTSDFNKKRKWPGQSEWVKVDGAPGIGWAPENRNPLVFRQVDPSTIVARDEGYFIDFGKAAFAYVRLTIYFPSNQPGEGEITVKFGELAKDACINEFPGAGVVYREFLLKIRSGTRDYIVEFPRYVSPYPYSQVLPDFIPEVLPFRYCELMNKGLEIKLVGARMFALHTQADFHASHFSSDDETLNSVYALCKYSAIANTFNGDYAASQRERMMYEADCYIHQLCHYAIDREFSLARYSLKNMVFHPTWPTEWTPHVIMMAWNDYMYTGNDLAIRELYHELKPKTLSALKCTNGLISTRTGLQTEAFLRSIHFKKKGPGTPANYPENLVDIVDWPHEAGSTVKGGETDGFEFMDYNTVVNAFHYHAVTTMAKIADACQFEEDARAYRLEAGEFKKVFNRLFLMDDQGIYRDGVGSEHSSLHANLYALAFGLVPDEHIENLLTYIKAKGMACGVYSANYLLEVLFDHDEQEHAIGLMVSDSERSWVNMMRVGSTMTIEAWDNKFKKNNGWSHAWSASPAHIIPRKLMGIEPVNPGFEKIRIRPKIGSLTSASAKVPTIRGAVEVTIQNGGGRFAMQFCIPGNTSARVVLPAPDREFHLYYNGKEYEEYGIKDSCLVVDDLQSGKHVFELTF